MMKVYSIDCAGRVAGGELIMLTLTNLPPIMDTSDIMITVDDAPVSVRGWQVFTDDNLQMLILSMPALNPYKAEEDGTTTVEFKTSYVQFEGETSLLYSFASIMDFS